MNKVLASARTATLGALICFTTGAAAQVFTKPPNLKPLPAFNVQLAGSAGDETLRFSTTSWNNGAGPLQLEGGAVSTGGDKQQVDQRIFNSDGTSALSFAGWFTYHTGHNHMHFDDYALYTLQPVNASGGSSRTGQKTTFCIVDTTRVDTSLPGAPQDSQYRSCTSQRQGMSVGWGDTYHYNLVGQEIDFTGNPDGIYQLKIEIDPKKVIVESNENDNVSCVLLRITRPSTVTVLDDSGSCATVTSITPNTARAGTTVQVTITGYGFAQGMSVTFEGGSGPHPVASNVQLTNDTDGQDEIIATVTVPNKKGRAKDPVWDVRVSTGGILANGFTVTR